MKNVMAIASGICDGMGFGDDTRAAVITRGLAELTRLGVALGGQPLTFAGLAGMGDLVATCMSRRSRYLDPLFAQGLDVLVIPGNHDSKNVGYLHFSDAFGPGDVPDKGNKVMSLTVPVGDPDGKGPWRVQVVAIDSSKPDLAEGELGRERYRWIRSNLKVDADFRVFVLHHHLVPVLGTGRERNTVWDAGDVLALLADVDVDLVLSGHKHVPYLWLLGEVLIVNRALRK